ncbi:unnamed protein product [Moneuplotes crassus]|uniref:Uncharacterized protein n=1 Tax=Euplotes crassus TaxID=5936 RepID=A0AAD1Y849_EUPCR|nr:unnamed protein product [Moneuplotes crassus]
MSSLERQRNPCIKHSESFKGLKKNKIVPLNELFKRFNPTNSSSRASNQCGMKRIGSEKQYRKLSISKFAYKSHKPRINQHLPQNYALHSRGLKKSQKPPVNPSFNFIIAKKVVNKELNSPESSSDEFDSLKAKFFNEVISRKMLDNDFKKSLNFYHPHNRTRLLEKQESLKSLKCSKRSKILTCPSSPTSFHKNSSLVLTKDSRCNTPLSINQISLKKKIPKPLKKMKIIKLKNLTTNPSISNLSNLRRKVKLFGTKPILKKNKALQAEISTLNCKQDYFDNKNLYNRSNFSLREGRYSTLRTND